MFNINYCGDGYNSSNHFNPFSRAVSEGEPSSDLLWISLKQEQFCATDFKDLTLLHHAVMANDMQRVNYLLKYGAATSINVQHPRLGSPIFPAVESGNLEMVVLLLDQGAKLDLFNGKGETPFHLAVKKGNEAIARLLLECGLEFDINQQTNDGNTPLHLAVKLNNEELVGLLIKHGAADSVLILNKDSETPRKLAIMEGRFNILKAMMEACPDARNGLNRPDAFGVTDLHRAARRGEPQIVNYFLGYISDDVVTNPDVHFTGEELDGCRAASDLDLLSSFPIDKIAFPLTIAQNNCYTMVRLTDRRVLKLKNSSALQVRKYLMQAKNGKDWNDDNGANVLTTYLSPGHGFLRLKCRSCNRGFSYNRSQGFYPTGRILEGQEAFNTLSAVRPAFKWITRTVGLDGFKTNEHVKLVKEQLQMFKTQRGVSIEEDDYEKNSIKLNSLKIDFYLSDAQAEAALNAMNSVRKACDEKKCQYLLTSKNCVDYVRQIFAAAGAMGEPMDYVTDQQVDYGHLHSPFRLFEFKAMDYAYLASRGTFEYFRGTVCKTLNSWTNQLSFVNNDFLLDKCVSNNFVDVRQLQNSTDKLKGAVSAGGYSEKDLPNSLNNIPSYNVSLEDNLGLIKVMRKLAADGFRQLNRFFTWHSGEKASLEETQNYGSKMWKIIENEMVKLDRLDHYLTIERSNPLILEPEGRALKDLHDQVIDLLFEGIDFEDRISDLQSSKILPSKLYLIKFGKEVDQFVQKIYLDPIGELSNKLSKSKAAN